MATKKLNYLDKIRNKVKKAVEEKDSKRSGNDIEFIPPVGKTKVRILPPINEDHYFYHTHSYNFLPKGSKDGKDIMMWSLKKYVKDGKEIRNPIDEAASQFFDSNDPKLRKLGGQIKRKRRFYFNAILVDEEDIDKKFVVLVDNTNEGKLTKQICSAMNIPLIRDIDDNWVVGEDEIDMDEEGIDLLSYENGHDFIIVKSEEPITLENGTKIKKAIFDASKPSAKPRALTKEELSLLDKRVDLTTFVKYEENLSEVEAALERYIDSTEDTSTSSTNAKTKVASKYTSPKIEVEEEVEEDEETDEETAELLKSLE